MAASSLVGQLTHDARRRREAKERAAAETPREQLIARNQCIILSDLEVPAALAVVEGIRKSINEYLDLERRRGL
jgi:hypothetical protein